MLFVAIILLATGYSLVFAGVKGDRYQIGGRPVWREPWLPFVAAFGRTPELASQVLPAGDTEAWYAAQTAGAAPSAPSAPSAPPASSSPSSPAPIPPVPYPAPPGQSWQ